MSIFIIKYKKSRYVRRRFAVIPWAALLILFSGMAGWGEAGGKGPSLPSFGNGTIQVRLYTDYFCPPCRDTEPSIEPILLDLVKNGTIHLTFVDVPTSQYTALYARHFLFALAERGDIDSVVHARRTLFEAAEKKVVDKNQLANLLAEKKIGLKTVDLAPAFDLWNRLLQEDQVKGTPSCVIIYGEEKKTHVGGLEIIKALEILRDNFGKTPAGDSKEGKAENGKKDQESTSPSLGKKGE
ncbi:MAG: thioredoxin domain-containing protein [Syntrophaceae bacterium]|nr:thioredoxin domain-containing protein [Syntrophaceae bacterium]